MKKGVTQKRNPRSLIATAAFSAVALVYVFFIFLPNQKTIAEMRRELDKKQEFLLEMDRLGYAIKTSDEELTLAKDYAQQWEARSPSVASLADFYESLSSAADQSQVMITKFDPQPVESMNHVCRLPIELSAEGTFDQMIQLLHKIESLETTVWLDLLSIEPLADRPARSNSRQHEERAWEPAASNPGELRVQCQMSMKVFADKSKFSD